VYLVDTDVVSELTRTRANAGVVRFFATADERRSPLHLSVVTIGEIERGIRMLQHRGDVLRVARLRAWFRALLGRFEGSLVEVTAADALAWAAMRVPHHENPVDKLIAASALTRGWTLVTRNVGHFRGLGVDLLNPFEPEH
jgi:predicted nucleic acid-binding protein